jgi:hypothetical protein
VTANSKSDIPLSRRDHRWIALGLALVLTLTGGVVYVRSSQRWHAPATLRAKALQLNAFPREIGAWRAVEDVPIDESALETLECVGYVSRRYLNQETGQNIHFFVTAGPPGPTAVHTPEICMPSRAYKIKNERTEIVIGATGNERHSFWRVDFTTPHIQSDEMRVYYAWSLGRVWKASRYARFEFAGNALLYKIQLAFSIPRGFVSGDSDPGQQFLQDLLQTDWTPTAAGGV